MFKHWFLPVTIFLASVVAFHVYCSPSLQFHIVNRNLNFFLAKVFLWLIGEQNAFNHLKSFFFPYLCPYLSGITPYSVDQSVPFPLARPNMNNILAICQYSNLRPRYTKDMLPRNGFGYLHRRTDAINRLESWFTVCCSTCIQDDEMILCCAQKAVRLLVLYPLQLNVPWFFNYAPYVQRKGLSLASNSTDIPLQCVLPTWTVTLGMAIAWACMY